MTRIKAVLGVLFIVGLCVCAVGASNASALTAHACEAGSGTGNPAFCPAGQQHIPMVGKQSVTPKLSSANTTLKATVGGVEVQIVCTGLSGSGELENIESGGNMLIKGSAITASFEGCSVAKPAGKGCTVPATIKTNSMKSETVAATMKQKYTPTEGTTFATVSVGGAECPAALKGEKAITGSATGEANEETGAQEFTATSGSELKFGGQSATVVGGSVHIKAGSAAKVGATTP